MKKFLLFAALFATAMAGYAQSFTVLYNNEPVANGATVICTDYKDETDDVPEENLGYTYDPVLMVKNDDLASHDYTGTLLWGSYPTKAELDEDNELVGDYGFSKWGDVSICNTQETCFAPQPGENLGRGDITVAGMSTAGFVCHLMTAPTDLTSEYKVTIIRTDKPDEVFECKIVYAPSEEAANEFLSNAGVDDIVASGNAAPVYYNLNGMKIEKPAKGLYIVKRGSKVTKEIVR